MKPAYLLLLLLLCGCLEAKPGEPSLRAFKAGYALEDGSVWNVELGPPYAIADADLQLIDAYRLSVSVSNLDGSNEQHRRIYWISGDFAVIREDTPCQRNGSACGLGETSWIGRGHWPPLGVGALQLAQSGRTGQNLWNVTQELLPGVQERGGFVELTFGLPPDQQETVRFSPYLRFFASFRYVPGEPVPSAIRPEQGNQAGEWLERTAISWGEVLPPIPPLRNLQGPPLQKTGAWFAGSGQDLMETSISPDQALDALKENVPAFRQALETSCLIGFLSRSTIISRSLVANQFTSTETMFQATTYGPGSSAKTVWGWKRSHDGVTGSEDWSFDPPEQQEKFFEPRACQPGVLRTPMGLDAASHVAAASAFPWEAGKQKQVFSLRSQSSDFFLKGHHPQLELVFQTNFGLPSSGASLLGGAAQSAVTGAWVSLSATEEELEAMPGDFG